MEFGKLPTVDQVDFSLPAEPPQNAKILEALAPQKTVPKIYLGVTGYNMKAWVGKWYPAGTKDKEFLNYYGKQFNTIEHNTTHYRIPDAATVTRWREEVPDDFRYCPKIPQSISHSRDLGMNNSEIRLFCEAIQGLDSKLGCCFLQLPPYFSLQHLPSLERFLERFPAKEIPLAVEVRHESFFKEKGGATDYYQLLQYSGAATVITDVAGRRDVCHMHLTGPRVLIRFVGNGLHPTDYSRIENWASRLKTWFDLGLQEVYFFCHEPDNLLAPELTEFAAATFQQAIAGAEVRGPKAYPPPPQQGMLF